MAETTPGPLISVVQFVGFMAAFRHPGILDPMVAGVNAFLTAFIDDYNARFAKAPVCTGNLNPDVVVVKSAKDRA
jgi:hypothetical protein